MYNWEMEILTLIPQHTNLILNSTSRVTHSQKKAIHAEPQRVKEYIILQFI